MKIRLGNAIFTAIAVGVGLVTLLGYFVNPPVDPASPFGLLAAIRSRFVVWASLLAAWAVVIGAFNLLGVHVKKVSDQAPGWVYSIFLFLGLVGVVVASLLADVLGLGSGPTNLANQWVFHYIITASAIALSGLLVFILVFAGYRLLRRRPSVTMVVFVVVAVISLVGMAPLPAGVPDLGLRDLWIFLSQVMAVGGARGLLLGVALGIVATGLRILLAVDRPYGE